MSAEPLDICIYGAGAVGGSLAVRLAGAGARVTVVARGAHAQAIRRDGLTLISGSVRRTARLPCPESTADIAPQDVLVVALKWPSVSDVAPTFSSLIKPGGLIVFAMNGIPWWLDAGGIPGMPARISDELDPGGILRRNIPPDSIVGAVVRSSNEVISPGVVENALPGQNAMTLGFPGGGSTPLLERFAAVLTAAGYSTKVTSSICEEIWIKTMLASSVGPVAALTGASLGDLISVESTREVLSAMMNDGVAIGRALGFTIREDVEARLDAFRGKPVRPSMLQDFELGRAPEIENSILAFAAIAKTIGIHAPVTQTVAALVQMKRLNAISRRISQ